MTIESEKPLQVAAGKEVKQETHERRASAFTRFSRLQSVDMDVLDFELTALADELPLVDKNNVEDPCSSPQLVQANKLKLNDESPVRPCFLTPQCVPNEDKTDDKVAQETSIDEIAESSLHAAPEEDELNDRSMLSDYLKTRKTVKF